MTKLLLPLMTIATTILFIFVSCDKIITNRYIGTWDFITEKSYYNTTLELSCDTIYFTGAIRGGMYNDEVEIWYTEEDFTVFQVKKKGELSIKDGITSYTYGKFEGKDKVHIELGKTIINGIKKSKK